MTTAPAPPPTTTPAPGEVHPQAATGATPHTDAPNPLYDRLIAGKTPADWAIRIVLTLVMTAALAVGTWSIYTLLTEQLHAPQAIAALGCGMFDVAALFFALLSQRYAVTTDSGLAPRTAMLAMICISSWVNWQHGQIEGWGTVGSVILAAAPVIAELAFEMFHRYAHREALRRLGRVAQTLPVLGKWAWLAHPNRARKTLDAHIRAALTEHEAIADRREELAGERARVIVGIPASRMETIVGRVETTTSETPVSVSVSIPALETCRTETGRETETTLSRQSPETNETGETETKTETIPTRSPETTAAETSSRDQRSETETAKVASIGDRETETTKLLDLMKSRGGAMQVSLNDAIEETGRPKATAAKRLKAARDLYLRETA